MITSKIRRPPPEILDPRIHHANLLNSILAKIEANKAGADDALMLDLADLWPKRMRPMSSSCAKANVATPRVVACPEGITRATVWRSARRTTFRMRETDLTLEDVYGADEMFCTGTMGELAGVTKLDGRTIGSGEIGSLTKRVERAFRPADGRRRNGGRLD